MSKHNFDHNFNNDGYDKILECLNEAAECHRFVRNKVKGKLTAGTKIIDVVNFVESNIVKYFDGVNDATKGLAFPCGININNIVMHDSAFVGDERTIKKDDVIDIDFGININGYTIDSAFTYTSNKKYKKLVEATKEATEVGIKKSGVDALTGEISEAIAEVINSYELEDGTKIRPIKNIGGHNIERYRVHGDFCILSSPDKSNYYYDRMEEGEIWAIETFATTGSGIPFQIDTKMTHYMPEPDVNINNIKSGLAKDAFKEISKRKTLPFNPSWLKCKSPDFAVKYLLNNKFIKAYPVLAEKEGVYSSHNEHTIFISPNGAINISKGNDY
jgi:methionyl aminopeptidase